MKYIFTIKEARYGKYWGDNLSRPIRSELIEEFQIENKEDLIKTLHSEIDPCDYELTDYNICKFVGWNIPPEKIVEFRKFYEYRNSLYQDMVNFVENTKEFGHKTFEVPEEYRSLNLSDNEGEDEEKVLKYEFSIYIY